MQGKEGWVRRASVCKEGKGGGRGRCQEQPLGEKRQEVI